LATAEKNECEIYRVILLGQSGTEVLVAPNGDRFALPAVNIPRWQRVAENLTAAVNAEWGEEVVCLIEPDVPASANTTGTHYQAAEHWRTSGRPKVPTQWVPFSALAHDSLIGASDYLAIQQSTALCSAEGKESRSGPFARPGWFKELSEWVETVIEPLGFHLKGNFRQLNASPSFSLVRFETDGPALWFKAVGEPNLREFPITLTLAGLFPTYIPHVFAARPEWNGWLTPEVEGTSLNETQEITSWETAAVALAKLQIESISAGASVLESGAHDLGAAAMSKLVDPFLDVMRQLMEQQTKATPRALSRQELAFLGEHIQNSLRLLTMSDIPDVLGSLDFNPGNIIASKNGCKFLDWAEAYVGHPFFTFAYLLEHFRRAVAVDPKLEQQLTGSYTAQWEQLLPPAVIAESLTVAPLLAVFAYASGCGLCNQERLRDPENAGYLRALTRRMKREANEMFDWRSACLS
jgi:hypothetical protein